MEITVAEKDRQQYLDLLESGYESNHDLNPDGESLVQSIADSKSDHRQKKRGQQHFESRARRKMREATENELREEMNELYGEPSDFDNAVQNRLEEKIKRLCKEKGRTYSKDWPAWNDTVAAFQGSARQAQSIPRRQLVQVYAIYGFEVPVGETWNGICKPTGKRFLSLKEANREVCGLVMGWEGDDVIQRGIHNDLENCRGGRAFGFMVKHNGDRSCFLVAPRTEVWEDVEPAVSKGKKLVKGFLERYTKCYHVLSFKQKLDASLFDEESREVLDSETGPIAATAQNSMWDISVHGTYTDLRAANFAARNVFVEITEPTTQDFCAQLQWKFRMRQESLHADQNHVRWHTQPQQWWDPPLADPSYRKWDHIIVRVEEVQINGPVLLDDGVEDAEVGEPFQPELVDGDSDSETTMIHNCDSGPNSAEDRIDPDEANEVQNDHINHGDASRDPGALDRATEHPTVWNPAENPGLEIVVKYPDQGAPGSEPSDSESSESEISEAD